MRAASWRLIAAGQPWVIRDLHNDAEYPYRDEARKRGYGSMIALPLRAEGELIGSLHILAAEADAFDDKETELLVATTNDLGYGIGALRARARALEAEATIKRMAHFDTVTELPNRVRLRDLLTEAIASAKEERRPVALLRIEMERFRDINETLGDREVDTLVREVAARLSPTIGQAGLLARVADSEFAVVLPRGGAEQAMLCARKILAVLVEPIQLAGLLLDVQSNIGISMFPGHGSEADALMRRASIALDQARLTGAGVSLFKGGLDRECAQRMSLMGDLRGAIERDELLLYCQPKLEMSSGRVCGAEALVRWQHPRLGTVGPGEFIKLAESTGLITPLTYWMLEAALRQSYAWHEQGLHQPLSVNLSARDLRDPKLLEHIGGSLATWGAQPGWIEFELTESALMEDPAGALETLTRLKRMDVSLTIDDYGTGYSSLSYLQRLPVDSIKIDQSFVTDMVTNKDSAAIVRSTIELAHILDLTVIAEGVEDQGTFERLAALGCDMAQGYCIGRPIPADQFGAWQAPAHATLTIGRIGWRLFDHLPAQRQCGRPVDHLVELHAHEPLGAAEAVELRPVPHDLGAAGEMQQVAGLEVGEHQADARLQRDVAERVEELVAGEVGPGQRAPVVADVHEARLVRRDARRRRRRSVRASAACVAMKNVSARRTSAAVAARRRVSRRASVGVDGDAVRGSISRRWMYLGSCRSSASTCRTKPRSSTATTRPLARLRRRVGSSMPSRPSGAPALQRIGQRVAARAAARRRASGWHPAS